MGAVDDPIQDRLAHDRVREEPIPVGGLTIGGEDRGLVDSLAHKLIKVVGLGNGEVPHGKVVQDQQSRPGKTPQPRGPGPVDVPAGEIGEQARGLGEQHLVTAATSNMAESLGDVAFSDADGPVQDDRLAGFDKAQRREVADLGDGDLWVEGEVELLDRGRLLEVRRSQATLHAPV